MTIYEGIFPIALTAFDEHGEVDEHSQLSLINHLIDCGVHGIAIFGNASEGYALGEAEKARLMSLIIKEVRRRVPVFVSTGHTGTHVAVQLSKTAEAAGADGLMILPPYFLKPSAEDLFGYYKAISDAVSIPIMIQDAPLLTGVNIGAAQMARMAKECANVKLTKVEAPPTALKVTEVKQACGDSLVIFGGLNGHFFLEELQRGARGTMPGSDMMPMFVRVWNLYAAGKLKEARAEFNRYLPLIRFELQPGLGVSAMKHNLKAAGVIKHTTVRPPTRSLDGLAVEELQQIVSDLRV
ncbi:MAG TPA: dihydrodipicolinate synthase family protein [Blastocatellia bacterium]|nr:dihydrodipicolinate synthase family protein [Blastocatellia bacterium]HMV84583.1 dihydrodipicolinate synthase family protein [Blastocatellia bacterium]HMX29183.1 dihydrodipicolinate synthase family protein [Blastocatellia bacterium]HMY70755.1 dihydrodipicolinate synthase family protein [Blastocatellia bacterium]HMZ18142.1 dihydrodipicolinate synthase family protein [Blastocatellia bacterium]